MRASRAAAFVVVALMVGALACVSERGSGPGGSLEDCDVQFPSDAFGSTVVVIRDFTFTPAQVRIRPGTKVTWVNCGPTGDEAHTSTSDTNVWGSPLLQPGATFTREFAAAGAYPYHCEPHPGMRGTVTVE